MTPSEPNTLYGVLGVPPTIDAAGLKQAYRRKLRETHPDTGGTADLFRLVQEAWMVLGHPARRAEYDRSLQAPPVAAPEPAARPAPQARWSTSASRPSSPPPSTARTAPPRARRQTSAKSYGHPGGSARQRYLDQLRAYLIAPSAPSAKPMRPTGLKGRSFAAVWLRALWKYVLIFAACGGGLVLFLALHAGVGFQGDGWALWSQVLGAAGLSAAIGAGCSLVVAAARFRGDGEYREARIAYRDAVRDFARESAAFKASSAAFAREGTARAGLDEGLLAAPFSAETKAQVPPAIRFWLDEAVAEENTARELATLGTDFSVWHDVTFGSAENHVDHLVVGLQGVVLVESVVTAGPITIEPGADEEDEVLVEGVPDPDAAAALRRRSRGLASSLGIAGVSAAILAYPDAAFSAHGLHRLGNQEPPTFAVATSELADVLEAGLPGIPAGEPWEVNDLRATVATRAQFA